MNQNKSKGITTPQSAKLSVFEALYMWIFIYTIKSEFLRGRGLPESAAGVWFAFLEYFNTVFVCRSIIQICKLDISFPEWVDLSLFVGLSITNILVYTKKLDSIVERHNALPEKTRLRDKKRMWIYVIGTLVMTLALMGGIEVTRENPPAEVVRKPPIIITIPQGGDSVRIIEYRRDLQ